MKSLSNYYKHTQFKRSVHFPFFKNLELGKASTDDKCHFAISWAGSCKYNVMQIFMTIFHSVQETGPFSLFQNSELRKASTSDKRPFPIRSLGLDLVNINVYTKFHHNISLSSRNRAIFTFSEFGARQSLDE